MKGIGRRKVVYTIVTAIIACVGVYAALRARPAPRLEYDNAFWPSNEVISGEWRWCTTPAGITYNLYIPTGMEGDELAPSIPLIVCFHGNGGKATAKDRFGRLFTDPGVQRRLDPRGAAVLVPQSRVEYFSDPAGYARLVENVILRHPAIDPRRVAAYGFSQGAAFAHEIAMAEPALFRAAATGSSYYRASLAELARGTRVRFYCALAKNDKGIYEQGVRTARALAFICPNSRYVEYEKRGHFFIEPEDKTGRRAERGAERGAERFVDWLADALTR